MWRKDGKTGGAEHTTLISLGTEVTGDLCFAGNLEIDGTVRGNITAVSGQEACVRILEQGVVEGDIRVPVVIVNGTVKGDIHSEQHIELAAQARVEGHVHYAVVEMVRGARLNGQLVYAGSKPALKVARAAGQENT